MWGCQLSPSAIHTLNGALAALLVILEGRQQPGTHRSIRELIEAITAFIDGWNDRCQPFVWTKDADTIIANAHRESTSGTRH